MNRSFVPLRSCLIFKLHALRVCRTVSDDVQFDSVLYTSVLARRYIEDTVCFVSLSFRRRVD